jgi:hypothetical protein
MRYLFLLFVFVWVSTCDRAPELPQEGPVTISRDGISLTVEPDYGGRITSLTLNGKEVLQTQRDSAGLTFGSTAWPSPQSDWDWPPPPTLDREPYTLQRLDSTSILLISKEDPDSGLTLQKRYRLGPQRDIGLTYWLTYRGDSTLSVAAWENTRLPYRGRITFTADSVRVRDELPATVETRDSVHTIVFDERHERPTKIFANLDTVPVSFHTDDFVLEKHTVVQDFYRVAPGQAPLEIYFNPQAGFMEFELQGDYRKLSYGQTATLRTKWVLREP